jgi:hypothetical protein
MNKTKIVIADPKLDDNLKKSIKDYLDKTQPKGGIIYFEEFALKGTLTEKFSNNKN